MKITMGTGGFVDLNTGSTPFPSTTGFSQLLKQIEWFLRCLSSRWMAT